jgi:hypothetical protein
MQARDSPGSLSSSSHPSVNEFKSAGIAARCSQNANFSELQVFETPFSRRLSSTPDHLKCSSRLLIDKFTRNNASNRLQNDEIKFFYYYFIANKILSITPTLFFSFYASKNGFLIVSRANIFTFHRYLGSFSSSVQQKVI